ncbi:uncharacterized protein G2W53_004641 [Senna tora]|uniref:Uncharacterized protein n=1 Tax=Senna tora TaxID=362788 RepID=A0A834XD91_9FABA|nr:uncharacterized protein G2W53_004641 [Senna tora]
MSPPAALAILGAKTTCELVGFVLMKSWKIGFTNCWIDGDGGGGDCDCKVWPFRGSLVDLHSFLEGGFGDPQPYGCSCFPVSSELVFSEPDIRGLLQQVPNGERRVKLNDAVRSIHQGLWEGRFKHVAAGGYDIASMGA